jgi:Arc/MetJ-type ribon-helix-helix transcriptional regulator
MSTITIPLTPELELFIEEQLRGNFRSKAELVRQALTLYREEVELQEIMLARQEIKDGKTLTGDLRELVKKFK